MNWLIIIAPEEASNQSFYLISQNYDSSTNHFSVAIGFAWAYKNSYSYSGYKGIATTHTHTKQYIYMKRCNWISNKSDYVTELLFVCLYSNDISGITDDVNTIYLCKRTMRYLFVKEQSFID